MTFSSTTSSITQLPPSMVSEARSNHRYPYSIKHRCCSIDIDIEYRRSPPLRRAQDECVAHRNLWAWVIRDGNRVGGFHIVEWCIDTWAEEEHLLSDMEAHPPEVTSFASALCSVWDVRTLVQIGTIVEFRAAWTASSENPDLISNCASVLLERFYGHRGAVALLHQGNMVNHAASYCGKAQPTQTFEYEKLDMTALPGASGRAGWMWQAISRNVPPPRNWGQPGER